MMECLRADKMGLVMFWIFFALHATTEPPPNLRESYVNRT